MNNSFYASIKLPKTITGFSRTGRNELAGIRVAVLDSEDVPKNTLLAMIPLNRRWRTLTVSSGQTAFKPII